jgi:LAO/AO transport system kinase
LTLDLDQLKAGDRRALARAATAVENGRGGEILSRLGPGQALVLGLTGSPGAGKSTLTDAIIAELRQQGKSVAVIAVDPSSPFSGGALLGDRIRMLRHHEDPGVFIRSMASRGELGGLAATTAEMARLFDGAGFDTVLVETVGVGQAEVNAHFLPGVTGVVLVPGMGDEIQAIKSGLMEIADVFIINKSDRPGADAMEIELRHSGYQQPIVRTVATRAEGVRELLETLRACPRRHSQPSRTSVRLVHVGIAVASIEQAVLFYRDQLGLTLLPGTPERGAAEAVELQAGECRLRLIEQNPQAADAEQASRLHHLALRVPDLGETLARLRAAGSRILNDPASGADGRVSAFVEAAPSGGVLLELIQK